VKTTAVWNVRKESTDPLFMTMPGSRLQNESDYVARGMTPEKKKVLQSVGADSAAAKKV